MAPYNPMKKHMDKLDEWGAAQSKKLSTQRDAGGSASLSDRLNLARGRDDRWERKTGPSSAPGAHTNEDQTDIVPNRSARVPPAAPPIAGRAGVPPPPQRSNAAVPPPPPVRSATGSRPAPPPVLPRRMDNENGTTNPPPPYPSKAPAPPTRQPSQTAARSDVGPGYIEFSKFGPEDKESFFEMLDEYFAARLNVSSGESSLHRSAATPAFPSADSAPATSPAKTMTTIKRDPPKPSGPGAKPSINARASPQVRAPGASAAASTSQWTYPRLSASNHPSSEPCKALSCASFFVYRDSYPEWSGAQPWFSKPSPMPGTLQGRRDIAWSSSSMYRGQDYTLMGAALFEDLSCLWWRVQWSARSPASTAIVDAAYREPSPAWTDEGRLSEAARGFGDWIAGFAEQSEQDRKPVGDGECWTLAAEAIKYTNATAQLTEENRLLTSIGRTHGHLIFAGKADAIKGQCGRWRGGDRMRSNWGGVRRGDIVEWRTARCRELNGLKGSYVTLGAPEHTAVIIDNAPVPERLSSTAGKRVAKDGESYYALLGVKPRATQAEIRSAYLNAARKHHPDRRGAGASEEDERIQQLNEANATLSDAARRAEYDAQLQSGLAGKTSSRSNATRVSATIDLDAMEAVDGEGEKLSFYYGCRCGGGFYINEEQLQQQAVPTVGCTGCSERIRIVSSVDGQAVDDDENDDADDDDDDDDQPELAPWELRSITTIEQSAGQVPSRRTYDLGRDSFTQGEIWIYRPVWEKEILGGTAGGVKPTWPPNLSDWLPLT